MALFLLSFLAIKDILITGPFKDCQHAKEAGHSVSGIYMIDPGANAFLKAPVATQLYTCYPSGYPHICPVSQGKRPRQVQGLVQGHTA